MDVFPTSCSQTSDRHTHESAVVIVVIGVPVAPFCPSMRCKREVVLSDEFEPVSGRPVKLSFIPCQVRATRQERRCVSA